MRRVALMAATTWLLAGCSTISSMNPVNWWHQQEGGEIAKQRPAPPGADQPYPNLATVPPKPEPPNQEDLRKLTASLVADRTNAQHAAEAAPIPDPSSPTASPALFGIGSAPPPPPPSSTAAQGAAPIASASMPAVTAPPAPATAPAPAPRKAVQSAPLGAPSQTAAAGPTGSAIPPASAPASMQTEAATGPRAAPAGPPTAPANPSAAAGAAPAASTVVATAAQPPLPAAPPPRPAIAGAPPPTSPSALPMPEAGGKGADIVFVQGTSDLSSAATDEVKAFAAQRGNAVIGVTGYGDTASSDPSAQSAALNLGLARAQTIVNTLKAAGVPGNAIRVSAEASGRGASLHLLQ